MESGSLLVLINYCIQQLDHIGCLLQHKSHEPKKPMMLPSCMHPHFQVLPTKESLGTRLALTV